MTHHTRQIAVVLRDTLQRMGLQHILADYFPPVEIATFTGFETLLEAAVDAFDFYITSADIFVLNADFFLPRKNKTVILISEPSKSQSTGFSNVVTLSDPLETIIDQLQQLFSIDNNTFLVEGNKELSQREIEVLQLIIKGAINKEIADKLSISLNTVLSHRKNITAKLGIKTVSGLTFYAIMNGYISADDIEL